MLVIGSNVDSRKPYHSAGFRESTIYVLAFSRGSNTIFLGAFHHHKVLFVVKFHRYYASYNTEKHLFFCFIAASGLGQFGHH